MNYTEVCRYRKKIVVYLSRSSETVEWLTPLVRHDDPNIEQMLDRWERQLMNVARTIDHDAICISTEKVPYKN